ncbi:ABC transporter ATP-binding protein/permease [Leisingera aquaemixtae]|uniref:ABC transporter ATP-binding protein n=1 Tax=Leisingera aquaemixtae TaxID=1396826 RepID=UPI001C942AB5|nr:ABC transporter ATP-binding protein [Leisingera aquaemixtae]MBY6069556.1 ABC transporter ATP-binding protein/permease [Leisingera aquaemixtae]
MPLICLRGFAEVLSVGLIFPFLRIIGNPELIEENRYLSWSYSAGGFESADSFAIAIGAVFVLVLLLSAVMKILTLYLVNRWLEMRKHSLSARLLETYLRQPYEFMLQRHSSELVSNMLAETGRVVGDVFRSLFNIAQSLVSILLMLALLFYVDPAITLLSLGIFGALYSILFMTVRRLTNQFGQVMYDENRARYRVAWEALRGSKLAKLFNRERSLISSYHPHSVKFAVFSAASNTVRQVPQFVIELFAIGGIVILTLALMQRSGGIGSAGMASVLPVIGVFALAVYRMMPAFQKGYTAVVAIRLSAAAAEAIHQDLAGSSDLPELPGSAIDPMPFAKSIELRNVSYTYPGAAEPSLKNISLTIPAATSFGIVGQTGAGKTTLLDLLLGLIEPTEGEMLIDGQKLDHDQIRAWRANVGYVPQEVFLYDTGVAQNIAFGLPKAEVDLGRVRKAARMAQIDTFIKEELPEGYDTFVGESGVRLSGGQRQRISIARALYTQPKVIAFDEATSALDNSTETLVMDQISELAGERTLIMVTHRLATVQSCDTVITLEAGRISGTGSYSDLTDQDGAAGPRRANGQAGPGLDAGPAAPAPLQG